MKEIGVYIEFDTCRHAMLHEDAWLYIVNFYVQITRKDLSRLVEAYHNIIIDNAQAYFDAPLANVDTLYTCRKFFVM